jgi:sugar phosphate isomerase/epimerase
MKRLLVIIVAIILVVTVLSGGNRHSLPVVSVMTESELTNKSEDLTAMLKGTFIQWWLVKDWDDAVWQKEFKALSELGMEYVVITPVAFLTQRNGSYVTSTVYPTEIDGFETLSDKDGRPYPDSVERCLKNAADFGIKVFIGLNFGDDWWKYRGKEDWMLERVAEGNAIALELWNKYRSKYPDSFYGWYWPWEVDNFHFRMVLDIGNT